ncbi:MAG: hypothetical protein QXX71_00100 [Candidatus Nanoarchaeia archaeon]|nr:hypothetical protein [Candidatus Haiyanarchaeum thermophilum]MCW1303152.1 hypothetical protein [Candidatus Haiyanarchaeum thermophilum]MCW1303817.1 hypothetical protein [Candidatus Haiyanarchaeum thermophilum]
MDRGDKRAQFFVASMVVIVIAILMIFGYTLIAEEIKVRSLTSTELVSRDVLNLKYSIEEIEQILLKEWLDFKFQNRASFTLLDRYEAKIWTFSPEVEIPKEFDVDSMRLADKEGFEVPSQAFQVSRGRVRIVFLDQRSVGEKDYYLYFNEEGQEPRVRKASYPSLVKISEKIDEFVVETVSYILHISKDRGGIITKLFIKDFNLNSIYNASGLSFQSKLIFNQVEYLQENCNDATFRILANGPFLGVLEINCSHKSSTGATIDGESFIQTHYYYPNFFLIEEVGNFSNQIIATYEYIFTVNSSVLPNYIDSSSNSMQSSPIPLGEIKWLDLFSVPPQEFGMGAKILSPVSQVIGINSTTEKFIQIRAIRDEIFLGEVKAFKILFYPHLRNFTQTLEFSELWDNPPLVRLNKIESLSDFVDQVVNDRFLILRGKGYSIHTNFSLKSNYERFSFQSDWADPTFLNRQIVQVVWKSYLPERIKVKLNGTVNLDSIKVTDHIGNPIEFDLWQEVYGPAGFEEYFVRGNEFYLLNLEGKDFNLTINIHDESQMLQFFIRICVTYPNATEECFQTNHNDTYLIQGRRGIYKVNVTMSFLGQVPPVVGLIYYTIDSTLPKLVVAGERLLLSVRTTSGNFGFHVPENKRSFSIRIAPASGTAVCNMRILDENKKLLKEVYGTSIFMDVENIEGGSFYYLDYNCTFSNVQLFKYYNITFTNTSSAIGNDLEHWFDFGNPEFYLDVERIPNSGKIYVYYNTWDDCQSECPSREFGTKFPTFPNLTIINEFYRASWKNYNLFRNLHTSWFDRAWRIKREISLQEISNNLKNGAVEIRGIEVGLGEVRNCSQEVRVTTPPPLWRFRREIRVKEVDGMSKSGLINITVQHSGKAKNDCRDVYLYDDSLNLMEYDLVSCNSSHLVLTISLSLPANSSRSYYVYYGSDDAQIPRKRKGLTGSYLGGVNIEVSYEETNPPQSFEEVEIPIKVIDETYVGGFCINFTLVFNTSLLPNSRRVYYLYYGNENADAIPFGEFGSTLTGVSVNLSEEIKLLSGEWFSNSPEKVSTVVRDLESGENVQQFINFSNMGLLYDGSLRKILNLSAGNVTYLLQVYRNSPAIRIKILFPYNLTKFPYVSTLWQLATDGTPDIFVFLRKMEDIPKNLSFLELAFERDRIFAGKGDYRSLIGIITDIFSIVSSGESIMFGESFIQLKIREGGEFIFIILQNRDQLSQIAREIGKVKYSQMLPKLSIKFVKRGQILIID